MIGIIRWSTERGVEPRVDATSNLLSTSVTRENGYTTISFARKKNTEDTQDDIDLSNSEGRFFTYGWGGTVDFNTNTIGYHPATPIVSTERVVIPSSATCTGNTSLQATIHHRACIPQCLAVAMATLTFVSEFALLWIPNRGLRVNGIFVATYREFWADNA